MLEDDDEEAEADGDALAQAHTAAISAIRLNVPCTDIPG